jgi:hypothetical protein
MRLKIALVTLAVLCVTIGWVLRSYWPPPGGYIQVEGPKAADRMRRNADFKCIEDWASGVASVPTEVKGNRDVPDSTWPECVRRSGAERVVVMADGRTVVFMPGTWRFVVRPQGQVENTCWSVGARSCVTYAE